MTDLCPRAFEVEALRDGRLSGAERARFEAHVSSCAVCKREAEALQELADALSKPAPPTTDELHVRRERTRLLAAFDARLAPVRPRPSRRGWAIAATLAAGGALFLALSGTPAPAPVATPAAVTVRAARNARWSRRTEALQEVVALESGALSIRVDPGSSRRLLVKLPDGELEDIGTVFSVSAADGQTTRVTVQEGSVVLRLAGRAPIALGAGDAWVPPPAAAPINAPAAPAAEPTRPATRTRAKSVASAEAVPDPAGEFRAAMAAFKQGDEARAAALFTSFIRQHPRDPRAEDAAYLRTLAYQRSGNGAATAEAARDYLTRYPRGFRRAEVETLLGAESD